MKTVKLLKNARVTLDQGAIVTVSEFEAWRLFQFGLAEDAKTSSKTTATKKSTTIKTTK